MDRPSELLVATRNAGKFAEITELLGDLPLILRDLSYFGILSDIDETGSTFSENAALKGAGYARLAGIPTIADDSGLVIDALGGRPGVHSARYAGDGATDHDRIAKVLNELREQPSAPPKARFVCSVALVDGSQKIQGLVEGVCEGTIIDAPRGDNGFGYDPIFRPDGSEQTFGELDQDTKNSISHRALAFAKIIPFLRGFFKL